MNNRCKTGETGAKDKINIDIERRKWEMKRKKRSRKGNRGKEKINIDRERRKWKMERLTGVKKRRVGRKLSQKRSEVR